MVHGKTYSDPTTGRFLKPEEVDLTNPRSPTIRNTGEPAAVSWEKMSKSKHNGVDPADCIRKYGADATRAHMLFQAPVGEVLEWREEKIVGIQRWFGRVWKVVGTVAASNHDPHTPPLPPPSGFSDAEAELWADVQRTIRSVTHALDTSYALNTVVSDLIKLSNHLASTATDTAISPPIRYHATSALLRMLAPLAPAFAEECWEALQLHLHLDPSPSVSLPISPRPRQTKTKDHAPLERKADSIFSHPFPTPDASDSLSARARATQTCVVQENGKLRFAVEIGRVPDYLLGSTSASPDGGLERDSGGESERRRELERWVLGELRGTEVGRRWLRGRGSGGKGEGGSGEGAEVEKSWRRIVVVKGGRTVNFVGRLR